MSDNGSGVAVINSAGQPVVSNTLITAAAFNALTSDIASMLSNRICRDGQTTITQNLPLNNKKITGLGAGTARTDAASLATIQDGTGVYVGTVGGTADAITLTPSPAITAYAAGQLFAWIASGANTTAVTLAVSGLASPKAVTKNGSTALVAGDIPSGALVMARYDGTRFQLVTTGRDYATITGTEVLTNKTLTSPTINTPAALTVGDNIFRVAGSSDATKLVAIEADGLTAGQTRTITMPDRSLTIGPVVTAEQSASGAATITFTGIPAGTKRITLMLVAVSQVSASSASIQLSTGASFATSGYTSTLAIINNGSSPVVSNGTGGFFCLSSTADADVFNGQVILTLANAAAFRWTASGSLANSNAPSVECCAGSKSMSGEVDGIRITAPVNFDAGTISVSYE